MWLRFVSNFLCHCDTYLNHEIYFIFKFILLIHRFFLYNDLVYWILGRFAENNFIHPEIYFLRVVTDILIRTFLLKIFKNIFSANITQRIRYAFQNVHSKFLIYKINLNILIIIRIGTLIYLKNSHLLN